ALQAELQDLDRRYSEEGRRVALGRQERELNEELTRLRERLAKYETAPGLETQAADDVDLARAELSENDRQLEAARTAWLTKRQAAEAETKAARERLHDVKQQRDQIVDVGED